MAAGKVLLGVFLLFVLSVHAQINPSDLPEIPGVSTQCILAFYDLSNPNITNPVFPAMMIDATGKSIDDLGKWDQCRDLGSNIAQYCLIRFSVPKLPYPPYQGVCIPAQCNSTDIAAILIANSTGKKMDMEFVKLFTELKEYTEMTGEYLFDCNLDTPPFSSSSGSIIMIIFSFLLIALVLAGTALDGYENRWWPEKAEDVEVAATSGSIQDDAEVKPLLHRAKEHSKLFQFFVGFSLVRNFKSMIGPSPPGLAFLNGMRAISIMWVILGHSLDYMNYAGVSNFVHVVTKDVLRTSAQVFPAAEFSVDSFFWLSGFLIAWLTITELRTKKRVNWFLYYFHRVWRLSPAYYYALFFYMFISTHLGEGPMWVKYLSMVNNTCGKYWWTNVLYVNNFIPSVWDGQCFLWGWYLAVDMQLYIIAPIIMYAYYRHRGVGWAIVLALLVVTTTLNGVYAHVHNLVWNAEDPHVYMSLVYGKPYTRAGPWLLGIACAFLYIEKKQLSRMVVYLGWLISAVIMLLCVYGPVTEFKDNGNNPVASPNNTWGKGQNFMYFTFAKLGWSLALSFLMYSMSMGWGGFVRRFLGAQFFSPLARLTYSTYLFHPIIMFVVYYAHLTYFDRGRYFSYDNFSFSVIFVGELFLAFCMGAVMFLTLERPMVNMEKLLIPHKRH